MTPGIPSTPADRRKIVWATGQTLPTGATTVELLSGTAPLLARLHAQSPTQADEHLLHFVSTNNPVSETTLVAATAVSNANDGGGFALVMNNPANGPDTALFSRFNYRSPLACTRAQCATTDDAGNFTAGMKLVTATNRVAWGPDNTATGTADTVILYDLPRDEHPISSLAQLQHFNTFGTVPATDFTGALAEPASTTANSHQNNYPIGNSYPNRQLANNDTIAQNAAHGAYDASWLLNDILWDRFFFSSFPGTGGFDFASATDKLINARHRPFRPQNQIAWNAPSNFRDTPTSAAKNLLIDGAFNINSTSVDAWKALLSSLKGVPINGNPNTNPAPFARTLHQTGGDSDIWSGFRNLNDTQLSALATAIVAQVRQRGPFLSMSDFVNRRLATGTLGQSGALQTALDTALGQNSDDASAGSPSYILQADLLSPLAPSLAVRSDTFVIRTYGDVQNPVTGEITARAWCEAIVQRFPDYVDPANQAETPLSAITTTNQNLGRRYQTIHFRWLNPDDI